MKKFVLELCVSNLEKYSDNSLVGNICKEKIFMVPRYLTSEISLGWTHLRTDNKI